jgi:hypothetical protein
MPLPLFAADEVVYLIRALIRPASWLTLALSAHSDSPARARPLRRRLPRRAQPESGGNSTWR